MNAFEPTVPMMRTIASICRCSSPQEHANRAAQYASESASYERTRANERVRAVEKEAADRIRELQARTPDPDAFEILDVEELMPYLVLKVKYPSCAKCAYEGVKVLVIYGRTIKDAIKWKRIDPHFRDPAVAVSDREAPSPSARFPGSKDGWQDALTWARSKCR